jgi:hypothetical protein
MVDDDGDSRAMTVLLMDPEDTGLQTVTLKPLRAG